jgi:signal transduction histidine kinase
MAEAVKKTTRSLTRVTAAQLDTLHSVCEKLAASAGTQMPPHLNSLTDIIAALESLADVTAEHSADIEEKKDEAQRLREELENLERLKSRFIRNVSHELRTPLASIEGFARALTRMETEGESARTSNGELLTPETRRQFLSIISQEAQRLGKLIEDVLDLSEIENHRAQRKPTQFTARELFQTVLQGMPSGQPVQVDLRIVPEPDGPNIYADEDALIEVFRQLLGNAQKFSAGQVITLGADQVSISPAHESNAGVSGLAPRVSSATRLYVRDRGVGIPNEELDRIFQKFYRIERPGFTAPGTGLGLSIVRALVSQNNGQVWAESQVGKGSTFYVLLPNNPPGVH